MYKVSNIIQDVDRKLHSGGTSQTQDFYGALDEARRNLVSKISPPELVRTTYIEEALYDQVERYAVPSELKFKEVINIVMLSSYRNVDTLSRPLKQVYSRQFSQKRPGARNVFAINYENGIKYANIFNMKGMYNAQQQAIHEANSLTEDGTWNVGGNMVNLRADSLKYITGTGSLAFDINNSSNTGYIENHTLESFDLEDFIQKGAVFTFFDIPVQDIISSIKITLGSDSTNLATDLYQFTVNRPHDGNEFISGWNMLRFPITEMSQVGTPNPKALTYIRFDITTTGVSMNNVRLENIIAKKGNVFEMVYNSSYCFIDPVTGIWKKRATANSDMTPLEEETYQILMLETASVIQKELYGNNSGAKSDITDIEGQLKYAYREYNDKYPSEIISPSSDTYVFGDMYSGYTSQPIDDGGDFFSS